MYSYLAKVQQMHPHAPANAQQKLQMEAERRQKEQEQQYREQQLQQQQQQQQYDYHTVCSCIHRLDDLLTSDRAYLIMLSLPKMNQAKV